ncbi:MAG: tetratricopeptide repeat protein [Chloroflexota bacterium]|nr:tetratricopeptide repeat protein [Chloroflexota bacterium]
MSVIRRHRAISLGIIGVIIVIAVAIGVYLYSSLTGSEYEEESVAEREITRLEELVSENPFNSNLRLELADYYVYESDYGKAIEQIEAVLMQNEDDEVALWMLGSIYVKQGDYEDALESYLKVVELNKDNPMKALNDTLKSVQYNLGVIYIEIGQPENAIEPLNENVSTDNRDADSRYMLGRAYQEMGEYEQAVEYYKEAVRRVLNFKEAYEMMVICYEELGDDNGVLYAEAMVGYCSGLYAEAVEDLEQVVTIDPTFVEAQLGLALSYEEINEVEAAIQVYETVIALEPENMVASGRLKRLKGV